MNGTKRIQFKIGFTVNIKLCRKCHREKSKDDFFLQKNAKDGRQSYCKPCTKLISTQYKREHLEQIRLRRAEYHKTRPEWNGEVTSLMKICSRCNTQKGLEHFYIQKKAKGGRQAYCKLCSKLLSKNFHQDHLQQRRAYSKSYQKAHPELKLENDRRYYIRHGERIRANKKTPEAREKHAEWFRDWRRRNPDKVKEMKRRDRLNHPDKFRERQKRWERKNPDKVHAKTRRWVARNRDKVRNTHRIYKNKRFKVDIRFKLKHYFGSGIRKKLARRLASKNHKPWKMHLPYTIDELISHLENQFKPGMSWQNYGKYWHIDHVIPDSAFDYKSISDASFQQCWSLNNLQPLWASENISKGNKII